MSRRRSRKRRSCPKGQIMRKGYTRRSRSGRRVRVKSVCIKDLGAPGKGPKTLPPIKKNVVTKYGYSTNKRATQRHHALAKAIENEAPLPIMRHLILIANYMKVSNPRANKTLRQDAKWIKKEYDIGRKRRSSKATRQRRSKRRSSRRSSKRKTPSHRRKSSKKRSTKRRNRSNTSKRRK